MRISIIGAGIGGLAAAIGLQRAGAAVTVFERASQLQPVGSGLSIFANGITALDIIGVGDAFRSITRPAAGLRAGQRRPDGHWLATLPPEAVSGLRIVHRADLHRLLLGALEPGTLRLDSTVTEVSDAGARLRVRTSSGEIRTVEADLIVAADGIRSATRAGWPGDPGLRYAGYSAWRGVTEHPVELNGEAGETWGRGLRFGIAPLADGNVYWFAVATMPVDAVITKEFDRVRQLFGHWHDPVPALLNATDPNGVFRLPIHDLAHPLPTFRRGRVVLLGDAAHAMTPDLGQGGGQALEDAATLATLIGQQASASIPDAVALDRALATYDATRRARTAPILRGSRAVGSVAHLHGRVAVALRDGLLGVTPSTILGKRAMSVQTWHPPA